MFQQHLYRQQLFNTLGKDDQLVDTVKLHLREKIINKLRTTQPKKQEVTDLELVKKICCSLFIDYLTEHRLFHTASIFVPESTSTRSHFSKQELLSLFSVDIDDSKSILEAVIKSVLPRGRLYEKKTDSYVQTDDSQCIQNLENKLNNIEFEYKQKMMMGLKNSEESEQRFLKYKNELNKRYKQQLESQLNRIRNYQITNIRIEEQQKNKIKIKQYQEQLDISYKKKYNDLLNRQKQMIDRITNKMKSIEKYNYQSRQKILRDMEDVKARQEQLEKLKNQIYQRDKISKNHQ